MALTHLRSSKKFDSLQRRILLRQNKGTNCIAFIPYDMLLPYALQTYSKQRKLVVLNEYTHLHTNSTSKKDINLITFSFKRTFFKIIQCVKMFYTGQIFMINQTY